MFNPLFMRHMPNRNKVNRRVNNNVALHKIGFRATIFIILYLCILAGGGAARTDNISLLYLRPVAVLSIIVYFISADAISVRTIKMPLIFFMLFGTILIFQMLPLPFFNWMATQGREIAAADMASGSWRPSSISPDRTLNSLISLVVPLAALIATQYFSCSKKYVLVSVIIGGLLSGAVAMMQLALGEGNALYFYKLTTDGAVGLFSNRNHQAVMLACLIPSITFWLSCSPKGKLRRDLGAASLICLILILIMVTGSRSGLLASLAGLLFAFALHDAYSSKMTKKVRRRYRIFYLLAFSGVIAIAVLAVTLGRNLAMIRLSKLDFTNDLRIADLPIFLQLAKDYFPFGSGGGTFDPAFRMIEPASFVKDVYVNHAHNELIETAITLGLPGLSILLAFIWWFVGSMINVMRIPHRDRDGYAMLGGGLIAIMMLASLTDYLLRTPSMGAFFAVACAWLSMGSVAAKDARQAQVIASDRSRTLSKFQDDLIL